MSILEKTHTVSCQVFTLGNIYWNVSFSLITIIIKSKISVFKVILASQNPQLKHHHSFLNCYILLLNTEL